jgi:hypothetical protein
VQAKIGGGLESEILHEAGPDTASDGNPPPKMVGGIAVQVTQIRNPRILIARSRMVLGKRFREDVESMTATAIWRAAYLIGSSLCLLPSAPTSYTLSLHSHYHFEQHIRDFTM